MDPSLLACIEDAGLNASAPPQQRVLDGWLLRFSPGKAKRARCVNAIGAGRLPLAEKLTLCEQAYADAGLPMIIRVTPFSEPANLDAALDTAGLVRFDDTRVMCLQRLDAIAEPAPHTLRAVSGDEYARSVGALRGTPADQVEAHTRRLQFSPIAYRGVVHERDGRVVACGQFALDGTIVGLYDVFTAADERRQGMARALCMHLLRHARDLGAKTAYLQVDADNRAARNVYTSIGFADAYEYHYRARETPPGEVCGGEVQP